jgi:hypothetical protein
MRYDLKQGLLLPLDCCICCFGILTPDRGWYFSIRLPLVTMETIMCWYSGEMVTGLWNPIFQIGKTQKNKLVIRVIKLIIDEFYREDYKHG